MTHYNNIAHLMDNFILPKPLGFGRVFLPIMFRARFAKGDWEPGELQAYAPLMLEPGAKVLHYGQSVFEGMKAFRVNHSNPHVFRPKCHWQRLNRSLTRLCMPDIPERLFFDGIAYITAYATEKIPPEHGQSLYLRPFVFATSPDLSLKNSTCYEFLVIASPSEIYHSGTMRVLIERDRCRAAVGGTGNIKAGGNYAAALHSARESEEKGFDQTLWLDPYSRNCIEELSGMNIFAVIDRSIHTPHLTGSILGGITRDSIIQLAKNIGYEVTETDMQIEALIEQIQSGQCTELFACGTATGISSISIIGEHDGKEYILPSASPVANHLKSRLMEIQHDKKDDQFGWCWTVADQYMPAELKQFITN
jgi:branched-chain amino acid aminotransferase